jgi:hypothetical protein
MARSGGAVMNSFRFAGFFFGMFFAAALGGFVLGSTSHVGPTYLVVASLAGIAAGAFGLTTAVVAIEEKKIGGGPRRVE